MKPNYSNSCFFLPLSRVPTIWQAHVRCLQVLPSPTRTPSFLSLTLSLFLPIPPSPIYLSGSTFQTSFSRDLDAVSPGHTDASTCDQGCCTITAPQNSAHSSSPCLSLAFPSYPFKNVILVNFSGWKHMHKVQNSNDKKAFEAFKPLSKPTSSFSVPLPFSQGNCYKQFLMTPR